LPESVGYVLKRRLLGPPLITARLRGQRLSNPTALGVLSPDAISSSAYGTEEILLELLPYAGLAAFTLLLPVTGVILVILVLVAASYRQVMAVYTRAGGSYVVARENFGPRVAQIAAAALLIDYVVTVAVQSAAGTVAVASAIPALGPYRVEITIGVVLLLAYVNLRGIREAGRSFAVPTYLFSAVLLTMIVVGLVRAAAGGLVRYQPAGLAGAVPVHQGNGLVMGATVLVLLRAFANGGSSLTGVEAISNTVSVFRPPQGGNARRVLLVMAALLGTLIAGVSYLAYLTHATPYADGYPSVLSQEARAVFGGGPIGTGLFALVQIASALILYTGANTSFNGFPFLASFVAEDRFLPRMLSKRGHRLVFSNGIVVLTVLSVALLLVTGATVNALVPFYAIGVFTGFAMAGYGMTRHHLRHREPRWRYKLAVNLAAGVLATVVVGIFAVAKFTEGAWLVVLIFPLLVLALIRLNRQYRAEAAALDRARGPSLGVNYAQHLVFVFVDALDLVSLEALRYGSSLRATQLTAVHFMIDDTHAERLRRAWQRREIRVPLEIVECTDRRLTRAAQLFVHRAGARADTEITVLLPRRAYPALASRLLHGHAAERLARALSRLPHVAATIVPYDVPAHLRQTRPHSPAHAGHTSVGTTGSNDSTLGPRTVAELVPGEPAVVTCRVHQVDITTGGRARYELVDDTGTLIVVFQRMHPATPPWPGEELELTGTVRREGGWLIMVDPHYRRLPPDAARP
jgi:amino acid transporter